MKAMFCMVRMAGEGAGQSWGGLSSVLVRKQGLAGLRHVRLSGRNRQQGVVGQEVKDVGCSTVDALSC